MKNQTYWATCKCGRVVERDARWEGRDPECISCKESRYSIYNRNRHRVLKKLIERIKEKHSRHFEKGMVKGEGVYELIDELLTTGKI